MGLQSSAYKPERKNNNDGTQTCDSGSTIK